MTIITGLGLLLLTLATFLLLSIKVPKSSAAMSGMANATVAASLMEAVHRYISGDLLHLAFLGETGIISGSMGGVVAAIMVPIGIGANPVLAVVAGVALGGYGILPGLIAGYAIGFIVSFIEKYLPSSLDFVLGTLMIAPVTRFITFLADLVVNAALAYIGSMTSAVAEQPPILTGLLPGGAIKTICMPPFSSMAPTAMLGPAGLSMNIAVIVCFGGSFTNGAILKMLHFGDNSNVAAAMMEPLAQAHIITKHPIPTYYPNFLEGGLSGVAAAFLGIINNASGTASLIPGLLAPFAFNPPLRVFMALLLAATNGTLAGVMRAIVSKKKYDMKPELSVINSFGE